MSTSAGRNKRVFHRGIGERRALTQATHNSFNCLTVPLVLKSSDALSAGGSQMVEVTIDSIRVSLIRSIA